MTTTTTTTKTKREKKPAAHRMMDVLLYVYRNDGCQQKDVMRRVYPDVRDERWGRQSPASFAVAALRRKGWLEDDCTRCPHCQRAARGRRNVELRITDAGRAAAEEALKKVV